MENYGVYNIYEFILKAYNDLNYKECLTIYALGNISEISNKELFEITKKVFKIKLPMD